MQLRIRQAQLLNCDTRTATLANKSTLTKQQGYMGDACTAKMLPNGLSRRSANKL